MPFYRRFLQTALLAVGLCPAISASAEAPPPSATPPTAQDFARHPTYISIKLSPTGKYMAVTFRKDGGYSLAVIRLADKKITMNTRADKGYVIAYFDWAGPERLVYSLGEQEGAFEQPYGTGELMAINADGSGQKYVYGYRGEGKTGSHIGKGTVDYGAAYVEDNLPEDPDHVLVMIDNTSSGDTYGQRHFSALHKLNVNTGNRSIVSKPPIQIPQNYWVDAQGKARLLQGMDAINVDETLNFYQDPKNLGEWKAFPFKADIVGLRRDGAVAYVTTQDGNRHCLQGWNWQVQAEKPVLTEIFCQNRASFYLLTDAQDVPFAVKKPFAEGYDWLNTGTDDEEIVKSFVEQFPNQRVRLSSTSQDHNLLLFLVDSDRNSGEFYLYDKSTGKADFLDALQTWIDPQQMGEQRILKIKARDGMALEAFLTLPPAPLKGEAKNLPLLVFPHGGPIGVADGWGWDVDAQFYASRGYAVLQVNYRGSGGYGQAFQQAGYREWGGKMIDDITDATRYVIDQGIADKDRVAIGGGSYGGYAALMSAVRQPELYKAVIAYAGVYDLPLLMQDSDVSESSVGKRWMEKQMGKDPAFLKEQSPINRLDSLKAPVFIIHGEDDKRCPLSQAKALKAALSKQKHPFEYWTVPEEGHGFFKESNVTAFYQRTAAFLDTHVKKP
jgi:pimeloyl-ACP methyl ester carboxylesterase